MELDAVVLFDALSQQVIAGLTAWISLMRAHAAVTRELSARLEAQHGLTLSDYDVLVQLYFAELQSRLAKAAAAAAPDVKGPVIAGNFEFELNRNLAVLFGRG